MEGDAEAIINAINGDTMLLSDYGHILHDIKLISSSTCSVSFRHIRPQGNFVSHRLARRVICNLFFVWMRLARRVICNLFLVWMEDVPPDILDIYNFDLTIIDR